MRLQVVLAVVAALLLGVYAFEHAASSKGGDGPGVRTPAHVLRPERAVLIFVDSLSDRVALDASIMPKLSALRRQGAAFEVEPCRDRLTHLCLRAAFTGHDEPSLLTLHRNFDPDRATAPDTVLHGLASAGRKAVALGTTDFQPYAAAFVETLFFPRSDESPGRVLGDWEQIESRHRPDLALIGLGSGDLAAHVHGTSRAEYRAAFANIDAIIGEVAARRAPDTHLVVLGDHGHDEQGRHLPGGPGATFALYLGPAFQRGVSGRLDISDNATLLGTLLGVPIPGSYGGPALDRIFDPSWVAAQLGGGLPSPPVRQPALARAATGPLATGMIALAGTLTLWLALCCWVERRALALCTAGALALTALSSGLHYDRIRLLLHDHGFTPERSLYLLVPFGLGFTLAPALRARLLPATGRHPWLASGATLSFVLVFLLLFPSAYYYGSSKATTYAALVLVGVFVAQNHLTAEARAAERLLVLAAAGFVAFTLATFCSVGQTEETPRASIYVLKAAVYQGDGRLPFLLGKLAVFALLLLGGTRTPLDSAAAAGFLTASVLVQLAQASLGRWVYAAVLLALVATLPVRRHMPMSRLAAGLFVLNHFYEASPLHLAPIELLLAATSASLFAFRRARLPAPALAVADCLALVTAAYLMLWPTLGFRLSGIDFRFMFQWVPPARYEELWWLIALGTLLKYAAPYLLLLGIPRLYGAVAAVGPAVLTLLAGKVTLLSLTLAGYAARHSLHSNQAIDMLSELALVALALFCLLPLLASAPRPRAAEPCCRGFSG